MRPFLLLDSRPADLLSSTVYHIHH